jgi:hypothetical protein
LDGKTITPFPYHQKEGSENVGRKQFSCDFETTTIPEDCRVWAYGYMEIGKKSNFKIGNSLEEFMEWCKKIKADLFFHNL